MKAQYLIVAAFGLATIIVASPASASTLLPQASALAYVQTTYGNVPLSTKDSGKGLAAAFLNNADGQGSANVTSGNNDVSVSSNVGGEFASNANITYSFIINGPKNSTVPILLMGSVLGYLSGGGGFDGASGAVTLADGTFGNSPVFVEQACDGWDCSPKENNSPDGAAFSEVVDLPSNLPIVVRLSAYASTDVLLAFANGGAELTLSVDPSFQLSNQFSISYSDGLGEAPLPSTWTMMLAGLALIGFAGVGGRMRNFTFAAM